MTYDMMLTPNNIYEAEKYKIYLIYISSSNDIYIWLVDWYFLKPS